MRGVHNIWRLIRTGATFERTGAMRQVLEAVDAPRGVRIVARVLGYPFKLLGYTVIRRCRLFSCADGAGPSVY